LKAVTNAKQLLVFIGSKSFLEKVVLMMGSERSVIRKEARKLIVKLLSFNTDLRDIMLVGCALIETDRVMPQEKKLILRVLPFLAGFKIQKLQPDKQQGVLELLKCLINSLSDPELHFEAKGAVFELMKAYPNFPDLAVQVPSHHRAKIMAMI